jgi:hypothetical protein
MTDGWRGDELWDRYSGNVVMDFATRDRRLTSSWRGEGLGNAEAEQRAERQERCLLGPINAAPPEHPALERRSVSSPRLGSQCQLRPGCRRDMQAAGPDLSVPTQGGPLVVVLTAGGDSP